MTARATAPPGALAAARAATRRAELERFARATDASGAGAGGGSIPGAETGESGGGEGYYRHSPVVYGTAAYRELFARAVALGDARDAAAAEKEDEEDEEDDDSDGDGDDDDDDDDVDASVDDDRDPFERYSVKTVAGKPEEEHGLWDLD